MGCVLTYQKKVLVVFWTKAGIIFVSGLVN